MLVAYVLWCASFCGPASCVGTATNADVLVRFTQLSDVTSRALLGCRFPCLAVQTVPCATKSDAASLRIVRAMSQAACADTMCDGIAASS